ncbi:MAG TPA: LptA/OstA family protein [bacterium]|nr:LptA/OstA family protein [bacterium]
MTLKIIKNPNRFNPTRLGPAVLTALVCFFAGILLSRADQPKSAANQITRKKPVSISSSQLTFDKLKGLTLFKGKVKALHGTVVLTADEIRAFSDDNTATAKGHVKVVDKTESVTLTCGNLEYQDLMETMTAHDHPALVSVDNNKKPVTILGREMIVDTDNKTIVVNQNVQIEQAETSAEAQKATFYANENKLVLEDDPRVYTSSAQITARRITTDMGEDKSFFAEGMADALFNPSGEPLPVAKKNQDQGSAEKKGKMSGGKNNGSALSGAQVPPNALATPGTAAGTAAIPTVVPPPVSSGQ